MKNGGKNKSVAFIFLFSVFMYVFPFFFLLGLMLVRFSWAKILSIFPFLFYYY